MLLDAEVDVPQMSADDDEVIEIEDEEFNFGDLVLDVEEVSLK